MNVLVGNRRYHSRPAADHFSFFFLPYYLFYEIKIIMVQKKFPPPANKTAGNCDSNLSHGE